MKFINYLLILSLCLACAKQQPKNSLAVATGIPYTLAKYRKTQVADVIYKLKFDIPKEKDKPIPTELELSLTINNLENDLQLDFNVANPIITKVEVNEQPQEVHHEKEHIIIAKEVLKKGSNSIKIVFNAGEQSLNRNDEFLYTLLVPDRASTLFPCFDQPDIKANYELTITAPKDWQVLCGAFEKEAIEEGEFTTHVFKQTDLMSTYLFSFVAGKFSEVIKNPGHFDMRFLHRETNAEKVTASLDKVFDIHQQSLSFLEDYTAIKFPFQKMDFATLPPFQYGGMEHVGAIQYRQSSLFLDESATLSRQLSRAKLIAHETAHMWFGDLVTMRWFDDVWMKEVFANFMADKIMNPVFPSVNHDLNFIMTHYPSAYSEDRTKGTNPIKQPLDNLKNAGSLYGRIIYNKAPIMMRQLETVLGKDAFQKGIQEYLKTYTNNNADWSELVTILDKYSEQDMKAWSKVWVTESGRPIITDTITYKEGNISSFKISQQAEDGSTKIWPQQFSIALIYPKAIKEFDITINTKETIVKELIGQEKPEQIIYNYNGLGYGIFPVASKKIQEINNVVARGYAYVNLYENMLAGKVTVKEAYKEFVSAISNEENELILRYATGRVGSVFWSLIPEGEREKQSIILSNLLIGELSKEKTSAIKKTLFNLLVNIGYEEEGKMALYELWDKNKAFNNLNLNENDYTNLAFKLAVYKHAKAKEILKTQLTRIQNPDRKNRFEWLMPTVSNEDMDRTSFMNSLQKVENRNNESWVNTALNNIHHPLHQKESVKQVGLCVDLLEEIQLTGDIFFPKRWLQSSVGNYTSNEALQQIEAYLKENPNLKPTLKNKLLQVTDMLYRAQKIKW